MRVGIDASNLRGGGGVTHLCELLGACDPHWDGFSELVIWGGKATLQRLPARGGWLKAIHVPMLDRSLPARMWWRYTNLPKLAREACDILFIPGGLPGFAQIPWVTMCQNMLLFELFERQRYGISPARLRLEILRRVQARSFVKANGLVFLSEYARTTVLNSLPQPPERMVTIPHGVDQRFSMNPRPTRRIEDCSDRWPFHLLYVSTVDLYKHQSNVVMAVAGLRKRGMPVTLELIGSAYKPALNRLTATINRLDPDRKFVRYHGNVPFEELHKRYHAADMFVYASTCENMPNILIEAMAAGLPIASSSYGPMPEVLGSTDGCFNPEDSLDIMRALEALILDSERRTGMAFRVHERAKQYSWEICARRTLAFLREVFETFHDDSAHQLHNPTFN